MAGRTKTLNGDPRTRMLTDKEIIQFYQSVRESLVQQEATRRTAQPEARRLHVRWRQLREQERAIEAQRKPIECRLAALQCDIDYAGDLVAKDAGHRQQNLTSPVIKKFDQLGKALWVVRAAGDRDLITAVLADMAALAGITLPELQRKTRAQQQALRVAMRTK